LPQFGLFSFNASSRKENNSSSSTSSSIQIDPAPMQASSPSQTATMPTIAAMRTAHIHAKRIVYQQMENGRLALSEHRDLRDNERIVIGGIDLVAMFQGGAHPNTVVDMLTTHFLQARATAQAQAPATMPARAPTSTPTRTPVTEPIRNAVPTPPRVPVTTPTRAPALKLTRDPAPASTHAQTPAPNPRQQQAVQQTPRPVPHSVKQRAASHGIPAHLQTFIDQTPDDVWALTDITAGDQQSLWDAMFAQPQSFWDDIARTMGPYTLGGIEPLDPQSAAAQPAQVPMYADSLGINADAPADATWKLDL
jgi:hypothetical protein